MRQNVTLIVTQDEEPVAHALREADTHGFTARCAVYRERDRHYASDADAMAHRKSVP
jgi:predicted metal-dependent HD superfamily phosphohydrolase